MNLEGECSEQKWLVGKLIEVAKALDNGHAAGEEDFVNPRDFFEVVYVRHGWRLDAEDVDLIFHTPACQFLTNAREGIAKKFDPIQVSAPASSQQKCVASACLFTDGSEIAEPKELTGLDILDGGHPSATQATAEGNLIDRFRACCKMRLGVHVSAGVGIKVEGPGVPPFALDCAGGLEPNAPHSIPKRGAEIDDGDHRRGCAA
jgi:hypothetical protein